MGRSHCDPYHELIPDIPVETLIEFSNKYVALFERVTGLAFAAPDAETPVRDRIRRALATDCLSTSDHGTTPHQLLERRGNTPAETAHPFRQRPLQY